MNASVTIEMLSYWHAGSGLGKGALADAIVLKDRDQLPWLPGKTVKGLFREGFSILCDAGHISQQELTAAFGEATGKNDENVQSGYLAFSDAKLEPSFAGWLKETPAARDGLFDVIASTSLDEQGVAVGKTLRTIEVCLPVVLHGRISLTGNHENGRQVLEKVQQAAGLIRNLGSHRHRGLGRCKITVNAQDKKEVRV